MIFATVLYPCHCSSNTEFSRSCFDYYSRFVHIRCLYILFCVQILSINLKVVLIRTLPYSLFGLFVCDASISSSK